MKERTQDPEISRRPTIDYDPEIEIDGVVQVQFGNIAVWFACTTDGDLPIAFEIHNSGSGRVCCEIQKSWPELIREVAAAWKGYRCAAILSPDGFARAWHANVDPYLFPKRKGHISVEMPLKSDTPPEIVADWLQDKGLDEAADWLRLHRPDNKRKLDILREAVAEFTREDKGHYGTSVAAFHNWLLDKIKTEDSAK